MILHLTLKKKWFDMTKEKIKREEYRDIKGYWASRLLYRIEVPWGGFLSPWNDIVKGDYTFTAWRSFTGGAPVFKAFTKVFAKNGYSKESPSITE